VAPASPTPNHDGGFNWGLRPGAAGSAPVAPPAASPQPPALIPPPEPPAAVTAPPTVPYVPAPDEATQPLSWDEFAASQQAPVLPDQVASAHTPPVFEDQPTEAYTVQPWQPAATQATVPEQQLDGNYEPTSAIDSLFGDQQFQAYEEVGVLKTVQSIPAAAVADSPREPRAPLSSSQKVLMGVAGGLIGVLILIGMFFLGQRIGTAQAATPSASSTSGSTNVPTPAGAGSPAAPGVRQWSVLQGGECIQPFSSAWAATFTVVDCTSDHDAEMVFKGKLPDSSASGYPTTTQFQTELTGLCSAPTAINYATAKAVTDLQVSFSYPPTESKWLSGDRTYYCFVDRQSGGSLTGDLSVQKPGS
jgi:Septum formation